MNLFKGLLIVSTSLTLLNCGGGNGNGSSNSSQVTRQYRTNDNGCDSHLHVFKGSSQAEVDREYCEALQDQALNQGCPTFSREDLFAKNCPGQVFTAKYPQVENPPAPEVSRQNPAPQQVSPVIPVTPQAVQPSITEKALSEAKSLEEISKVIHFDDPRYAMGNQHISPALAKILESKLNIILSSKNTTLQSLFLSYAESNLKSDADFMNSLCEGFMTFSDEDLSSEAAGYLLSVNPSDAKARNLVRASFHFKSADARYNAVFRLGAVAGDNLGDQLLVLNAITDSDSNVRNIAQTTSQGMKLDARHLTVLKKAFKDSDADVRYDAAVLVGMINDDAASQLLIQHMADPDNNVSNIINTELQQRKFSATSVAGLISKFSSGDADVRYNVATLLGSQNSDEGTLALISHLSDTDSNVSNITFTLLQSKSLGLKFLASLVKELEVRNADARYNAATLIGRLDDPQSVKVLIEHMDDSDSNVSNIIFTNLQSKTLVESHVTPLTAKLNSGNPDVRYDAATLLGKVASPSAKAALKRRLAIEKDSNVSNLIETLLNN